MAAAPGRRPAGRDSRTASAGPAGRRFSLALVRLSLVAGEPATTAPIADMRQFAQDLADCLNALGRIDAEGGPGPGAHNFGRGGPLSLYDAQSREAIAALGDAIDAQAVTAIWDAALASEWRGPDRWLHGDIAPGNLLVRDGRLSALIDFGCCAVGDPACDLSIAWSWFESDARAAFRKRIDTDDACWVRGRGWALWKALIVAAGLPGTNPAERDGAAVAIERIVGDYKGATTGS